jgi:hypothetical protein
VATKGAGKADPPSTITHLKNELSDFYISDIWEGWEWALFSRGTAVIESPQLSRASFGTGICGAVCQVVPRFSSWTISEVDGFWVYNRLLKMTAG